MQKNHLEYSPGATTFRSQHRSRVAGPVDATGGGQSSQSESPPRVKGSKTQVQLSAMALDSCAASDRKANESLILRLKDHAEDLCLFWQAGGFDAVEAVRWAVGERVFVDCDVRQNLCGIELLCDSVRVTRAGSDQATITTTIQG